MSIKKSLVSRPSAQYASARSCRVSSMYSVTQALWVLSTFDKATTRASKKRSPVTVAVPSRMLRKALFSSAIRSGDWFIFSMISISYCLKLRVAEMNPAERNLKAISVMIKGYGRFGMNASAKASMGQGWTPMTRTMILCYDRR